MGANNQKIYCASEYDVLKRVMLCEPQYMTIRDVINEAQKHYKDEGIHIETAVRQHREFVSKLRACDVEVVLLPYHKKFPEQVFTRDIGFTLGEIIFVADMAQEVRDGEEDQLKQWLEDEEVSYYNLIGDYIEGGDVIIDNSTVFVGLSNRTNQNAANHLRKLLTDKEIVTIPFKEKYLHLDCVFNVISPDEALCFPEALGKQEMEVLNARYDLIEVTSEEQFTLGTNVLNIGEKRIFSLPVNKNVNKQLRERGYDVIEVDISEIIKSGGSFRCCTLPILRQ
ncbi:dimethylarginine dimethylaminohydrolase family protein [Sediminibacillus massiliensis]|uniref:dimethylarginine dimethylaminohydrolase family protein n=1 Tax=Sediminibacillus massiliensis TaxID=1926277 RepID=UPI0009885289|nr:dimethylarginine dimethylaminohydrolase family protein [Sediminibacillus massiliensis]